MVDDTETLDKIALLLRVVNSSDAVLSGEGIDLLSEWVSATGRKVR